MPRYAAKVDRNHAAIRECLRARGWYVRDQSRVGEGWPDLFLAHPSKGVLLAEVKDGSKVPSAQKLTRAQADLHCRLGQVGVRVVVLRSVEDAAAL